MPSSYTVIDPHELFAASGADLALFRSLSHIFLDTAPVLFGRMEAALQGADFIPACHSLRGMTALVGAHSLTALLAELERLAHSQGCSHAALAPAGLSLDLVLSEVARSIVAFHGTTG